MTRDSPFGFGQMTFGSEPRKERDRRRAFTKTQKNEIWAQQNGKCGAKCPKKLDPRTVEYDHIKPWADKGRTIRQNGAALCPECHRLKTHKERLKKLKENRERKEPGSNHQCLVLDLVLIPN